jgi:hypothetical protein
MKIDLDTFLTALYCVVDDIYRTEFAPYKPRRRGKKPDLSDSEVLTLELLFQYQRRGAERRFVDYALAHWQAYFPRVLSQSAFNRRARDLAAVLCHVGLRVARRLFPVLLESDYEVLDGLPVPLMRRCRGDRHRLFGDEAGIGRGGSDRDWYYGVKWVAAVNAHGIITGFVLAPASTEERWAVDGLLRWRENPQAAQPDGASLAGVLGPAHRHQGQRRGPTGPLWERAAVGEPTRGCYLADEGQRGEAWQAHWRDDYGASVLTPAALVASLAEDAQTAAQRHLRSLRQVIETVNATLDHVFGIKFPRARTLAGLLTRIAAKVAAHDILICLNHLFHRPSFAHFDPFSC